MLLIKCRVNLPSPTVPFTGHLAEIIPDRIPNSNAHFCEETTRTLRRRAEAQVSIWKPKCSRLAAVQAEGRCISSSSSEDRGGAAQPPRLPTPSAGAGSSNPTAEADTDALSNALDHINIGRKVRNVDSVPAWARPVNRNPGQMAYPPPPPQQSPPPSNNSTSTNSVFGHPTYSQAQNLVWFVRGSARNNRSTAAAAASRVGGRKPYWNIFTAATIRPKTKRMRWLLTWRRLLNVCGRFVHRNPHPAADQRLLEVVRRKDSVNRSKGLPTIYINPSRF